MHQRLTHLLLGVSCTLLPVAAQAQISFLSGVSLPYGGEIVSYANGILLTTNSREATSHAIQAYTLETNGTLTLGPSIDLSSVFDGATNIASISSVLADSRGFGVATVIPVAKDLSSLGRIAFFDFTTGTILKTLDVGYHPDSVTINADRTRLLIANEGEYGSTSTSMPEAFNRPGSVSVVNLSGVFSLSDIANLTQSHVSTYDFTNHLAPGVNLNGVRNNRLDTLTSKNPNPADIEPEYITATTTHAYVTLQENNAIATLDLTTGLFVNIKNLGSITQVIDASDRDGPSNTTSASINDTVAGLPMPDTIKYFMRGGTVYLITANEGDARPDDYDIFRAGNQNTNTNGSLAPDIDPLVDPIVNNQGIGRLNILKDQGDTDNDGDIDVPTMMGTRSFSIWQVDPDGTISLAFDSGSIIENYVSQFDPTTHNINNGLLTNFDTRSDDKGPEPEAIEFATINGRDYVFVGAERQNGIFQFDITDLNNVFIVGYYNPISATDDFGGAFISPESILFLDAASNPTGQDIIIVGFEGTGSNGSIAVFSVIPEPASAATFAGFAVIGCALLRRRPRSMK